MVKYFRMLLYIISLLLIIDSSAFAQSTTYDPAYGPPKKYQPIPLVKRLSYENFKHIKLLTAAIHNYGGGQQEMDKLIDQYAEGSALYFQNKYEKSADVFLKNENDIFKITKKIALKYYNDSSKLLLKCIKLNIKYNLSGSLKGEKTNPGALKTLNNARFAVKKGNDYLERYKNANVASPRDLLIAIYYYRRAKENLFLMIDIQYLIDKDEFLKNRDADKNEKNNLKKVYNEIEKDRTLTRDEKKLKKIYYSIDINKSIKGKEEIKKMYNLTAIVDNRNKIPKSKKKGN